MKISGTSHCISGSKATFADRQQQVGVSGVELQLVDGVAVAHVVLRAERSLVPQAGCTPLPAEVWLRPTLMHCMLMWLMMRMMPREPATASSGWLVLVSYVHAHV